MYDKENRDPFFGLYKHIKITQLEKKQKCEFTNFVPTKFQNEVTAEQKLEEFDDEDDLIIEKRKQFIEDIFDGKIKQETVQPI